MDLGAEAFIVRRPEALALVTELGLAGEVVSPGPLRPAIWSGGRLHPLPAPAVMGIPGGSAPLGDLIDDSGRDFIDGEVTRPLDWQPGQAVSVGEFVRDRFGDAVVARSVDPMLGGVYSARADDLGLAETIPALAAALDAGAGSLTEAVAGLTSGPRADGPVFGTLRGGYRRLVDALIEASAARIRTGAAVTAIDAAPGGFAVTAGGESAGYGAVVVALPPWRAAPLLRAVAPAPSETLARVRPAGSAVAGCVLAPGSALPEHSGILVASDAGMHCKAVTLSTQKWPHLKQAGPPMLRVSFGRLGEPVDADDATLTAWAVADLDVFFAAAGLPPAEVVATVVQRWPEGLPHYAPGHLAAMAEAVAAMPAGLSLAGSALRGVGVPACIAAAREAAASVADHLPAG